MRALVVPNTDIITKEQLITELEADGVTITDASTPEIIWVEMANREQFNKWLASEKVAGANSEDYENKLRFKKEGVLTSIVFWAFNSSNISFFTADLLSFCR